MGRTAKNHQPVSRILRHDRMTTKTAEAQTAIPDNPLVDPEAVATLKEVWVRVYKMLLRSSGRDDKYINTKTKPRSEDDHRDGHIKLNVWEKIIEALTRRGLHVTGYAYYAMTVLWNSRHDIYPNMLLSHRLLDQYQESRAMIDEQIGYQWNSNKTLFRSECHIVKGYGGMTAQQQQQFVLLSRHVDLSPLFRFLHSWINDLPKVCDRVRSAAVIQYGTNPCLYDDLIAQEGVMPDLFRESLMTIPRTEAKL